MLLWAIFPVWRFVFYFQAGEILKILNCHSTGTDQSEELPATRSWKVSPTYRLLNLSEAQFSPLWNANNTYIAELVQWFQMMLHVKNLTYGRCAVHRSSHYYPAFFISGFISPTQVIGSVMRTFSFIKHVFLLYADSSTSICFITNWSAWFVSRNVLLSPRSLTSWIF